MLRVVGIKKAALPNPVPLCVFLCLYLWLLPEPTAGQEADQEIVANLAAGRVVIYVAKDGIVVGSLENNLEADTRAPRIIPLSAHRLGVLLGAVEWLLPSSSREPVRLDRELLKLFGQVAPPKSLQPDEASDIESIGLALLEPLRSVAQQIHRKVELSPEEPLVELILVGYVADYGPEVWSLRYPFVQEPLRGDYWRTRVLRPHYTQLYPPEKGQPRTLIEVRYPPDEPAPALLDLLNRNDPRLARIRIADQQAARAAESVAQGHSNKALAADATQFLRAALGAIALPDAAQILALIDERRGFDWVLAPPDATPKAEEAGPREPSRPTLRKKP